MDRPYDSLAATNFKKGLLIVLESNKKLHKQKCEFFTLSECLNKAEEIVAQDIIQKDGKAYQAQACT